MPSSTLAAVVFTTHGQIEAAVGVLVAAGCDRRQLSVVGKDYHTADQAIGCYNADGRVRFWGKFGSFWSRLSSQLHGGATLAIPGFGYFVALGPLADAVMTVRERAIGGGFGALCGALIGLGIPLNSVTKYEHALRTDQFVLIAQGSAREIEATRDALAAVGAADIEVYGAEVYDAAAAYGAPHAG
jgi:hypothetical protein